MRRQQPEMQCFTFDVPETPPVRKPERKKNEDINEVGVSPAEAFAKFAGKSMEWDAPVRAPRPAPLVTIHVQNPEAPLERYTRLKAALGVFRAELQALPKSHELASMLAQEIAGLEATLESVAKDPVLAPFFAEGLSQSMTPATSQLLGSVKPAAEVKRAEPPRPPPAQAGGGVAYELYTQDTRGGTGPDLLSIERRLAELERTIGMGQQCCFPDVESGIAYLRRKIAVLENPRELATIMRQVNNMMAELEALDEQRMQLAGAKTIAHESAIHTLYSALSEWDAAARQLPALVARLQSIKDVCEQGAAAPALLSSIQVEQGQMDSQLAATQTAYGTLVTQLSSMMKQLESSVGDFEKRFGEVEKRKK